MKTCGKEMTFMNINSKIPWQAMDKDKITNEDIQTPDQTEKTNNKKNRNTMPTVYPDVDFINRTEP